MHPYYHNAIKTSMSATMGELRRGCSYNATTSNDVITVVQLRKCMKPEAHCIILTCDSVVSFCFSDFPWTLHTDEKSQVKTKFLQR